MAEASYVQSSFLGGQWSKSAQGRVDRPDYRTAMNVCLNGLPIESGAWTRRPGTRFLATTYDGKPGRLISFAFQQNAPYNIEFTDGFIRFFTGSQLAMTNTQQVISSISTANPAVVTTATAHGWTTGNQVQPSDLGVICPLLQNRQFNITVTGATTFSIADPVTGAGIDGSTLGWVTPGSPAHVSQVQAYGTVYTGTNWQNVRIVQAETTGVVLHPSFKPYLIQVTTAPSASAFAQFSIAAASFLDGPYFDPIGTGTTLTPSATTGSITITAGDTNFQTGGFVATDVGRSIRLLTPQGTLYDAGTAYGVGNIVQFSGVSYTCIQAGTGHQPDVSPTFWTANGLIFWTWGIITARSSGTVVTVSLKGPLSSTGVIATWRLGLYSDTTGWPSCGCYHEGRLWLSGSVGNRIDSSMSNQPYVFSPTDGFGAVAASNGISAIFNASDVNAIYWMSSDERGIVCGTQAGEWLVSATALNNPLTPLNIQAHRATKNGCANIEPRRTGLTIAFVQAFGRSIMEYFADVFSGRFSSPNLAAMAKDLTVSGIQELAYVHELSPVIWARRADGTLTGITYKRESLMSSQGPTFVGWHQHQLGSGRVVESISAGPSSGGNLDALAMVTNDPGASNPSPNLRHVELMTDIFEEGSALTSAWFLDDAVIPSSMSVLTVSGVVSLQMNGLWHLNGSIVSVFAAGLDCGDFLVTNGSIVVPFGDGLTAGTANGQFSQALYNSYAGAMPAVVGFTYASQGQCVRPNSPQESGARNGPALGKKRRTHYITALLVNTIGISFGENFTKPDIAILRNPDDSTPGPFDMFSGVYWDAITCDYTFDSMLSWQITRPYPATVAAIGGSLETADH